MLHNAVTTAYLLPKLRHQRSSKSSTLLEVFQAGNRVLTATACCIAIPSLLPPRRVAALPRLGEP